MSTKRRCAAGLAIVVLAASCGVPTGPESFEPIDDADVPNRLNETTTTTTTTTIVVPTTLVDQPAETTTTTTEPEAPTELVDIYFLSRGQLRAQPTEAPAPATANDLILLLQAGPALDLLDTEIAEDLIVTTSEDNGVLSIALDDRVFQRIPPRDQREAIAQIVLTFLNNLRGVGLAVFTIDDVRLTVPIGNGQFTAEPVSRDDYENMLVDADPDEEAPTTTATTTTASTVAPTTEP